MLKKRGYFNKYQITVPSFSPVLEECNGVLLEPGASGSESLVWQDYGLFKFSSVHCIMPREMNGPVVYALQQTVSVRSGLQCKLGKYPNGFCTKPLSTSLKIRVTLLMLYLQIGNYTNHPYKMF